MSKFVVTKENVEEIMDQIYEMYNGRFEKNVIRWFFGEWYDDGWVFKPEWFEGVESIEQVFDSFDEWSEI